MADKFPSDEYIKELLSNLRANLGADLTAELDRQDGDEPEAVETATPPEESFEEEQTESIEEDGYFGALGAQEDDFDEDGEEEEEDDSAPFDSEVEDYEEEEDDSIPFDVDEEEEEEDGSAPFNSEVDDYEEEEDDSIPFDVDEEEEEEDDSAPFDIDEEDSFDESEEDEPEEDSETMLTEDPTAELSVVGEVELFGSDEDEDEESEEELLDALAEDPDEVDEDPFVTELDPAEDTPDAVLVGELDGEDEYGGEAPESDFAVSVSTIEEPEESFSQEEPEPEGEPEEDPLYVPLRHFRKLEDSYDTVPARSLEARQLCPEGADAPVADSNVAVTTWRTLLVRYRRTFFAAVFTAILLVITAVFETVDAMGEALLSALSVTPGRTPLMLIDLLLLTVSFAIFLPKCIGAFKPLKDKTVTPDFVAFLTSALSALFLLVRAFVGEGTFYVALPAVLILFVAQLCHLFALSASYGSAQICLESRGGTTTVLRRAKEVPEVMEAIRRPHSPMTQLISVSRFGGQHNFLRKLGASFISGTFNLVSVIAAAVVAAGGAALFGVYTDFARIPDLFGVFAVLFAVSIPLSVFLLHTWAHLRLFHVLRAARMAAAGEETVYESDHADVMCFADTEAIPSTHVKVIKIKLSGDNRLDKVFGYLAALFSKLGGPLDGHFRVSGVQAEPSAKVYVREIADDGVCAQIDGRVIHVGRGTYMQRNKIPFYYDPEDEEQLSSPHTAMMFVAADGVGCAKLYLHYEISEDFERMVEWLQKEGVSAIIRTSDPNISSNLLAKISYLDVDSYGLVRTKLVAEAERVDAITDSLIAFGVTPAGIYRTGFLFAAYKRMQRALPLLSLLTTPISAALCLLVAAGSASVTILAVLCQLIGTVPVLLAIEAVLHKHQIGDKPDDQ